jgi:flavin-dependent dehydrogenase
MKWRSLFSTLQRSDRFTMTTPAFAYDVIIAGGGPAGSTTASFLRKFGHSVLVLEKEQFPRFHLGESLLPCGGEIWDELEVSDEMKRRYIHKPGARFVHNESGLEQTYYFSEAIRPDHPFAYEVPRADFDDLLLRRSESLGAVVCENTTVTKVRFEPDYVEVAAQGKEGSPFVFRSPLFVDATGRDTFLGTKLGLKVSDELVTTNVACFTHYEHCKRQSGEDEGNITVVLFDGGWWWFIPFKGTVTSVGCTMEKHFTVARRGMTPEQLFAAALEATPAMQTMLEGATRVRPVDTTGNWSYRCTQFYGDRFLLVGDSAAFIDPLFSTGVLMAVTCGKFAAEAIHQAFLAGDFSASRFAEYQTRALQGAEVFKGLVHEFYARSLRPLLVRSSSHKATCAAITSALAGDVYRAAMWQGLFKEGFSLRAVEHLGIPIHVPPSAS